MIFLKKIKKLIIIILTLILLIVLLPNFYVRLIGSARIKKDLSSVKDADYILVLGAGLKSGKPSDMLRDRLDIAIELYNLGVCKKLLMSGDHTDKYYDEVSAMKSYAVENGVKESDIYMDHAGISTYDSMYRAKNLFNAKKIIVVTQRYHIYRALYIAENLGIEAYGSIPASRLYKGAVYREIREILARDKDLLKCIFKPKSKIAV